MFIISYNIQLKELSKGTIAIINMLLMLGASNLM